MKTKNVIMPILAFVVAIGMAFATTPINGFTPEVWRGTGELDCHETNCVLQGEDPCEETGTLYRDNKCSIMIPEAFKP